MQTQLEIYQQRVQSRLTQIFSAQQTRHSVIPEQLMTAMKYATLNNGKRLRPALLYATGEGLQIPISKLDSAACAIELIHSYSLVHDDLPAMDDDELRRGKPTCHIRFDEATAILVGDAQQTLAFEVLSSDSELSSEHKVRLIQQLSQSAGMSGMIGGQMIDIQSEGCHLEIETLKTMHSLKTGALIKSSLLMGAAQSPLFSDIKPALEQLGDRIGLAFQVQDDILDIESDSATLGKPQGSDLQAQKSTYPALLGLKEAKRYRDQLINEAQSLLGELPFESPFLQQLVTYIATRSH